MPSIVEAFLLIVGFLAAYAALFALTKAIARRAWRKRSKKYKEE